ncbi:MAG: hypothetical protein HFF69_06400 [Oscillospiraceae bacterium]|jgi:hypothetical protein|nr:hypothetical protein [Oscillospiraceae bacterium]
MRKTETTTEKTYPTEALLKSKALADYQQDFARVLLTKPAYTVREAAATLDRFCRKGVI